MADTELDLRDAQHQHGSGEPAMSGRAKPAPDRPDRDGRNRRREDGDPREEQVEHVKSPSRAPQTMAPVTRSTAVPRYRPASIDCLLADHEPGDRDREERPGAQTS